jgi:hypothetical protein
LSVEGIEDEDDDGEIEEREDEQGVGGEEARIVFHTHMPLPQGLKARIDWGVMLARSNHHGL